MSFFSSLAGGLTSAVGGIFAGKAANKGYKQQQQMYLDRLNEVKTHRDNVYYQDPTQNAETQAAVTGAQKVLDASTQRAAGTNAVAGGTDESVALAKGQAAQAVGNIQQSAAVNNQRSKEQEWNNSDNQIDAFDQYLASSKAAQSAAKAKAISSASSGLTNAVKDLPW